MEDEAPSAEVARVLVDNHRGFLGFVEKRVGSRAIAEDILQDAFVRSIDKVESIESDEAVVAWFYRVLRNAVVDHYRRRGAASRGLEAFARELEVEAAPSAEVTSVVCKCVGELAKTLKPEYADALQRIEIEGAQVKDYASEHGISPSNAGVRVFRAREALKKQVARACGTCAEHGCLDCTCRGGA
jgi:RNA polymerase sigma-70 factor (ECF subfamily)